MVPLTCHLMTVDLLKTDIRLTVKLGHFCVPTRNCVKTSHSHKALLTYNSKDKSITWFDIDSQATTPGPVNNVAFTETITIRPLIPNKICEYICLVYICVTNKVTEYLTMTRWLHQIYWKKLSIYTEVLVYLVTHSPSHRKETDMQHVTKRNWYKTYWLNGVCD
jgi:hypothetical protein